MRTETPADSYLQRPPLIACEEVVGRSAFPSVRNPLLNLPAMKRLQALPPETRAVIADLLQDLRNDARSRAEKSWRTNKPPMACYWKVVGVLAYHTCRAIRPAKAKSSRAAA